MLDEKEEISAGVSETHVAELLELVGEGILLLGLFRFLFFLWGLFDFLGFFDLLWFFRFLDLFRFFGLLWGLFGLLGFFRLLLLWRFRFNYKAYFELRECLNKNPTFLLGSFFARMLTPSSWASPSGYSRVRDFLKGVFRVKIGSSLLAGFAKVVVRADIALVADSLDSLIANVASCRVNDRLRIVIVDLRILWLAIATVASAEVVSGLRDFSERVLTVEALFVALLTEIVVRADIALVADSNNRTSIAAIADDVLVNILTRSGWLERAVS